MLTTSVLMEQTQSHDYRWTGYDGSLCKMFQFHNRGFRFGQLLCFYFLHFVLYRQTNFKKSLYISIPTVVPVTTCCSTETESLLILSHNS